MRLPFHHAEGFLHLTDPKTAKPVTVADVLDDNLADDFWTIRVVR